MDKIKITAFIGAGRFSNTVPVSDNHPTLQINCQEK
jgi:hypothetical protein